MEPVAVRAFVASCRSALDAVDCDRGPAARRAIDRAEVQAASLIQGRPPHARRVRLVQEALSGVRKAAFAGPPPDDEEEDDQLKREVRLIGRAERSLERLVQSLEPS